MNTLIISLESQSYIPLYEQIYQHIKMEIQQQNIKAGERLPSSRALCSQLSVSRSTVDLAYEQLVSEGYIESVPCKGYYVCEIEELYQFSREPVQMPAAFVKQEPLYTFDFALNGIAPNGFPYRTWKKLSKLVLQEENPDMFQLGSPCGEYSLREAISRYLYEARGVVCTPDRIIVGAGNDYLLMLLSTITGTEHVVAMENPTYYSAYQAFMRLGYDVKTIPLDDWGMRMEELERSGADIAYVMPSHQFPMGCVMPLKRRLRLLGWAAAGKRYIIEDDYDSEFRYKGKPIPALAGFDKMDRVIYLGTFSKSIAPAIRISYMVLPKKLMSVYEKQGKPFSATVSKADQKIIEYFLRDGYYERHLNKMRSVYRNKLDVLLGELKGLSGICRYSGERAGVHILVHFINGLSEAKAIRMAQEKGVKVYGLSDYLIGEKKGKESSTVLMGYATLEEAEIVKAMQRLKEAWS